MNFELSEQQVLVQDTARRFALEEIAPTLEEEEKNHEFRQERVALMGELGFLSCVLPEDLGGNGMGFLESVLMAEQIAQVSASWRLPFNMQNLGPSLSVAKWGTDEQKEKYIPGWINGTRMGFFAMTEPNAGSDVSSMKTYAIDQGDHWELHGSKLWITNAHVGDAGLLYAYTDREKGNKGMSCFILEPKNRKVVPPRLLRPSLDCIAHPPASLYLTAPGFQKTRCWAKSITASKCVCGNWEIPGLVVLPAHWVSQAAHWNWRLITPMNEPSLASPSQNTR
jgi:glutaryl-CoA dehydrogenase (non-decarboxylating)